MSEIEISADLLFKLIIFEITLLSLFYTYSYFDELAKRLKYSRVFDVGTKIIIWSFVICSVFHFLIDIIYLTLSYVCEHIEKILYIIKIVN